MLSGEGLEVFYLVVKISRFIFKNTRKMQIFFSLNKVSLRSLGEVQVYVAGSSTIVGKFNVDLRGTIKAYNNFRLVNHFST